MKKILPIALLLVASASFAQNQSAGTTFLNKQVKAYRVNSATKAAQKTTATYWRLSATSTYSDFGIGPIISDSTYYKYSNARGSSLNLNQADLEFSDYGFDGTILCDTQTVYQEMGSGLELSERYINSYTSGNLRSEIIEQYPGAGTSTFENDSKYIAVRDGNNNIVKQYILSWYNGNWDTAQIEILTYNGSGKLILDSSYSISGGNTSPFQRVSYSYDGNGNMTGMVNEVWSSSAWDSTYQEIYTWINNKQTITVIRYKTNNKMENAYWDSVGYDNNGIYVYNLSKEWNPGTAKWENSSLETRVIANGQPASAQYSEWDGSGWDTSFDADFTYNSNGDATSISVYEYVNGTKQSNASATVNLYYEHYFNVGVDELAKKNELKVYPNPATNVLHVASEGNVLSAVRLISMTGQTVYSTEMNGMQLSIPVSGLATGNYILSVGDTRQLVTIQ